MSQKIRPTVPSHLHLGAVPNPNIWMPCPPEVKGAAHMVAEPGIQTGATQSVTGLWTTIPLAPWPEQPSQAAVIHISTKSRRAWASGFSTSPA